MTTPPGQPDTLPSLDKLRSGPPTISVKEAARDYLGVSRAYGYAMARNGHLPIVRLGAKRVRVSAAGLLKMLEGQ